jgi:DGQHR domain-containing protein
MNKTITCPAARVNQGNLRLYTTSLTVRDLMTNNFYDIERLDPENPHDRGYQRLLNKARAKKLADYLTEGQENHDAFLPTSIFLATDKDVAFDPATNTISFDVTEICPFAVVDGQHRLEGLRMAAEKNPDLLEFEVPVNIAVNLNKISQMCHFLIVNTTQKSVDKSVEQRINARLTDAVQFEDVPTLPKWIQRIILSEDDKVGLQIADYLNTEPNSPWFGKIEMANQEKLATNTVTQRTFVNAIKKYVLTANNPVFIRQTDEKQKIFLNYWRALANLLDIDKPTVLYKYNGVELFCRFSTPLFNKLQNMSDFKVSTIEMVLQDIFENLEGDYAGVGHPDWWLSGTGAATSLNSAAIGKIMQELNKALHRAGASGDIEL